VKARNWIVMVGLLLGLTMVAAAADAAAGGNAKLVGVWSGSSSSSYDFTMTLKEQDGKLQGDFEVQGTDMEMENLAFDGAKISFNLETGQGVYNLQGTVDGNSMSGTFKSDEDSGTWKATRGKAAASAPAATSQQ